MSRATIRLSSIDLFLLVLISTVLTFFTTSIYTAIRYIITIYLFIKYGGQMKKAPLIYSLILAYSFILGISSYQNNHSVTWGVSGFMRGIQTLCIFSTLSGITEKRGIISVITTLTRILAALLIPTDILIFGYPYKISSLTVYLIGDKFHVSYMHCLLLGMIGSKYDKWNRVYLLPIYVFSMLVVYRIKCTTGLIMLGFCFVMEIMLDVVPDLKVIVCHISLVAILLVAVNILIWGTTAILSSEWANHIIVDILGKTSDMTGRSQLYSVIPELIAEKPVFGYGFQSDIFRDMFGYGNAQNGLIQIVIEAGLLGAGFYFVALYLAGRKEKNDPRSYSFYMYLLAFVIGSISEMNLSTYFAFGVAMLYSFGVATQSNRFIIPGGRMAIKSKARLHVSVTLSGENTIRYASGKYNSTS